MAHVCEILLSECIKAKSKKYIVYLSIGNPLHLILRSTFQASVDLSSHLQAFLVPQGGGKKLNGTWCAFELIIVICIV